VLGARRGLSGVGKEKWTSEEQRKGGTPPKGKDYGAGGGQEGTGHPKN